MERRYMKYRDLCDYLGICLNTAKKLKAQGSLPYIQLGGNVRFDRQAVDDALARLSQ